jgi:hypothetical protein
MKLIILVIFLLVKLNSSENLCIETKKSDLYKGNDPYGDSYCGTFVRWPIAKEAYDNY